MQSNDDRTLDEQHVTLKVTVHEPTKFYVVTLGPVPWVVATGSGWTLETVTAPTYSGPRHPFLQAGGSGNSPVDALYVQNQLTSGSSPDNSVPDGGHSAWFDLGATVPTDSSSTFPSATHNGDTSGNVESKVYTKIFPAGVANLPGNSDVGGTYLLFLQGIACAIAQGDHTLPVAPVAPVNPDDD